MNAKQLKNAILQLAIQGKLVPQDPADEPASVLLARIRKEKEQLLKTGKLKPACRQAGKKDLATTPISDEEKPFEIPESWEWCRLGEIVRNNGQKKPETIFSYIDIGSIDNKRQKLNSDENLIEASKAPSRARKIIKFGDIIYSTVRPYLHNMAIVDKEFLKEPIASTGFAVLTTIELYNKYLFYYLMSPQFDEYANDGDNAKGIAYPAINDAKLYKAPIPLPPLAEQHRIVSKIEELMPMVEEFGAAQEKLDRLNEALPEALKKSILQQAIQGKLVPQDTKDEPASALLAQIRKEKEQLLKAGKLKPACRQVGPASRQAGKKDLETTPITDEEKPFEIPESWEWVHFEDIAQGLTGKTPERGNQEYWSNVKYPWVSISDMTDYGHVKYTKEAVSEKATKIMRDISTKGSLLMSFKLTVGRTSILDIDAYHNEAIITVKPYIDNSNILRDFLFRFLPLITEDGDTKDAIKGRTLNAKSIASLLIPLPPLAEQHRIVAKIEELMALVDGMK